ncbi:hypothetical protein ATZ33_15200 [Enterococcus silesiacus]|uniref:Ferrochelatase n=1 Tax=Enterococcus silesiacus TaxID=332949 RepID=A0A0S3KEC0_9ENTE|nr:TMEM175 family protein [Enterococcus silesiacus]ALS02673.1 hypothetical protein ATZ33_15200 [Enterococcus silesiacus]OJG89778.1 hypothetical protein RV15_GL001619 [Enterococcus silesiacus]
MNTSKLRIELFSDAVIAIVITIAALEIPVPNKEGYGQFIGSLITFTISFFIIADYWNNQRRLFERIEQINERFVFRNTCFLFSLVLIPICTKWLMEASSKQLPALVYGLLLIFINAMFSGLFTQAIPLAKKTSKKVGHIKEMYKKHDRMYYLAVLTVMGVGYFIPQLALLLFIGVPIISYFLKTNYEEVFEANREKKSFK